ncbi:hypothetical protein HBH98_254700 [Parastagonospora nodorum]|nr:hypothetical protein HBH53_262030 [Parastagonospora nodorum]KAH3956038.1 hypothetical protein HBH51_257620 [Parastagonospora nodorum]KAH4215325.1 hypothetical protein HBI06_256480 [Parastagonospora nodorum]KAH4222562.1 hypothetical protein HBI05_254490 [Parastagonospora nodorum]KAH4332105.1 hypothetical protein HBH98_254700 [Parastagonospora nodorum]
MNLLPFLFGAALAQIVPFDQTLPVLTSPVVQVEAGRDLHFQLVNFRNVTCHGTLMFSNATYLPISGVASPRDCAGDQIAKFRVPHSAPNGAAALEWQCSGVDGTSVNLLVISGGTGDWEEFLAESGIACIIVQCRTNTTSTMPAGSGNVTCL